MNPARSYSPSVIKAGHLGSLAADERATILLAGVSDAADDLLGDLRLQLAGGEVVHEKHGCGALHGNVVDAVIDQVGADGVVQVHLEGDFQLGANAVDAGDQHRVEIALLVDGKQAAKAADLAEHAAVKGFMGEVLDALLGAIGALNVDTGVGVSDGAVFGRLLCQGSEFHPEGVSPQVSV